MDDPPIPVGAWTATQSVSERERERDQDAPPWQPVERIGRFAVLRVLGQGGMGRVLVGYDEQLDRKVAIKLLREPGRAGTGRARLLREAQALARLSHPNVVQIHEVGTAGDSIFIAMELVEGQTLTQWCAEPRSWEEGLDMLLQAGRGLEAAHDAGLVHRDFKPDNVLVGSDDRVRVLDFGLVRGLPDPLDMTHPRPASTDPIDEDATTNEEVGLGQSDPSEAMPIDAALTAQGSIMGTPVYMAPEQHQGQPCDASADQFAFCVSAFEALYGIRPYAPGPVAALGMAKQSGEVLPIPADRRVPRAVHDVIVRGLLPAPADRWPDMTALLTALEQVRGGRARWRAPLLAAGATALVLGGAGAWLLDDLAPPTNAIPVADPCSGATAIVEEVWGAVQRQEVKAAIEATGVPYAAQTWTRVEQGLDDYARRWADKHTKVCEATSVRAEQSPQVMDLRMECLRRRRLALQETIDVLTAADSTRVERAINVVASLPRLERCDDIDALQAALPPPRDPADAERVEVLRARLEQGSTLRAAGDYAADLTMAQEVTAEAETLAHGPLIAEALLHLGKAWQDQGDYAQAERDLEQAFELAAKLGHDDVMVEALVELTWTVGAHQARYEQGLGWGRVALALSRGPQHGTAVEAGVLNSMGTVLAYQGEFSRALTHFQQALTLRTKTLGPTDLRVAGLLMNVGNVLRSQGKPDEALAYYRRTLAVQEEALGSAHPRVAQVLDNIGTALADQGKFDEALVYCRRALTLDESTRGRSHPRTAGTLTNIGIVLGELGQHDASIEHHRRALAIYEQTFGPTHPSVVSSLDNLGTELLARGDLAQALEYHQRALTIGEATWGSEHPDLSYSHAGLAQIALAQRDFDLARVHAERAFAIREAKEFAPKDLAYVRFVLARALWADPTQRQRARSLAEYTREVYTTEGAGRDYDLSEVEAWLGEHPAPTRP